VIRYFTAAEIRDLWSHRIQGLTVAEVYRLASENRWRRVNDRRRPALYHGDDVELTLNGTIEEQG
jgi:hypothetical protein